MKKTTDTKDTRRRILARQLAEQELGQVMGGGATLWDSRWKDGGGTHWDTIEI